MSQTIQADPDDLTKHGNAFGSHASDMTAVHDGVYALLASDIGLGDDDFSRAFAENYLTQVRSLADSVKGARDGVLGVSQGMLKMASDYRAVDEAAARGVSGPEA